LDRHLEITLVSGALTVVWGYALQLCLREGRWLPVTRKDNPAGFWTVMLVLGMAEAGFIGLALMNFAAWLDS
jgi:hypothetical protein